MTRAAMFDALAPLTLATPLGQLGLAAAQEDGSDAERQGRDAGQADQVLLPHASLVAPVGVAALVRRAVALVGGQVGQVGRRRPRPEPPAGGSDVAELAHARAVAEVEERA